MHIYSKLRMRTLSAWCACKWLVRKKLAFTELWKKSQPRPNAGELVTAVTVNIQAY